jgi:predicted O-methyltransferase YrrM
MNHFNNASVLTITRPIEGWLTDSETLLLYHLARTLSSEGHIVEIGSWKGKSTIALALGLIHSAKSGVVWAVDPHQGIIQTNKQKQESTYKAFIKNVQKAQVEQKVRPIIDTSAGAAKRWKKSIRLLFIDGLHDYEHVQADIAYWSSWVVNNGVIAFHDAFCAEKDVWDAIRNYMFHRSDIIDIGTASSILYIQFGKKTLKTQIKVFIKKLLITLANEIHMWHIPWSIKVIIIHRVIRMLLWNNYLSMIYRKTS